MVVVVLGSMRFPPDRLAGVAPHLEALLEATRTHDGCMAYDAAFDPFEPGLVRFSELWPDMATLEAHLSAPHIAPWRAAAAQFGVSGRSFTAWEAGNPRPV